MAACGHIRFGRQTDPVGARRKRYRAELLYQHAKLPVKSMYAAHRVVVRDGVIDRSYFVTERCQEEGVVPIGAADIQYSSAPG
jgi:hypothetical protein